MIELARVWYQEENAIVREKVYMEGVRRVSPLLTQIFRQGIEEGTITSSYPERVGEVVMCLVEGLSQTYARYLLAEDETDPDLETIRAATETFQEALERVLGAPAGSLKMVDNEIMKAWFGLGTA